MLKYLLDTRAVVLLEATRYAIGGALNLTQLRAIGVFCFRAHAGHRHELGVFLHTLLQLAKENSQARGIIGRPEGACEGRHRSLYGLPS